MFDIAENSDEDEEAEDERELAPRDWFRDEMSDELELYDESDK